MDERQKQLGRQVSALRLACNDAAEMMLRIRHVLEMAEPDAVWMAEEGWENLNAALKRADRFSEERVESY